jgi:hypothetical protein
MRFAEEDGYTEAYSKTIGMAVNQSRHGILIIGTSYSANKDDPLYAEVTDDGLLGTYRDTGDEFVNEWWKLVNHEALHNILDQIGECEASTAIDGQSGQYTRFGLPIGWLHHIDLILYREVDDV